MGNQTAKDFFRPKEGTLEPEDHYQLLNAEVFSHSGYLRSKWDKAGIKHNEDQELNIFGWTNVQKNPHFKQQLQKKEQTELKERLLVGFLPNNSATQMEMLKDFDDLQVAYSSPSVCSFKDIMMQKFLILHKMFFKIWESRKKRVTPLEQIKIDLDKVPMSKSAEIGIKSGISLMITLIKQNQQINPELQETILNFIIQLLAEVKPLDLWGEDKMYLVLDSSLEQVNDYLEQIILTEQNKVSKCKALKALLSLGLARGSLPNLLTAVKLINSIQVTNGIQNELVSLGKEQAMTFLSFVDQSQILASEKIHYVPKDEDSKKEDKPQQGGDKVPYASAASDGKYLYVHTHEGLFKIGIGRDTLLGKVYKQNKEYRNAEKGSMIFLQGKLLFRSSKTRDLPFVIINIDTLEEDVTTEIAYDKDCPNALYVEGSSNPIEFSHEMYQDFQQARQKKEAQPTRPVQRSPMFTDGRLLYVLSQWTEEHKKGQNEEEEEDEEESKTQTKVAKFGVDIYDPLNSFTLIRSIEIKDTDKNTPAVAVKSLETSTYYTNGKSLIVHMITDANTRVFKKFDLTNGKCETSINPAASNGVQDFYCYDYFNNLIWQIQLKADKSHLTKLSCYRNQGSPPKINIDKDNYVSSEWIINQFPIQQEQSKEEEQHIEILQNLGFSTVEIDLNKLLEKSYNYKHVVLNILANLSSLAESYSVAKSDWDEVQDMLKTFRRPHAIHAVFKTFDILCQLLQTYVGAFQEQNEEGIIGQYIFLSIIRILRINLNAANNCEIPPKYIGLEQGNQRADNLKKILWEFVLQEEHADPTSNKIRKTVKFEILQLFQSALQIFYPTAKDILDLIKSLKENQEQLKISINQWLNNPRSLQILLKDQNEAVELLQYASEIAGQTQIAIIEHLHKLGDENIQKPEYALAIEQQKQAKEQEEKEKEEQQSKEKGQPEQDEKSKKEESQKKKEEEKEKEENKQPFVNFEFKQTKLNEASLNFLVTLQKEILYKGASKIGDKQIQDESVITLLEKYNNLIMDNTEQLIENIIQILNKTAPDLKLKM